MASRLFVATLKDGEVMRAGAGGRACCLCMPGDITRGWIPASPLPCLARSRWPSNVELDVWEVSVWSHTPRQAGGDINDGFVAAATALRRLDVAEETVRSTGVVHGPNGTVGRFLNGLLHTASDGDDEPSRVTSSGTRMWHHHGRLHRRDPTRPVVEQTDGLGMWLRDGHWIPPVAGSVSAAAATRST